VLLGACAAAAVLSAAALIGDLGADAARWLFAGLFATSVLAFFCALARDDAAQTKPEQMASFRLNLLQEEMDAFHAAHAQLRHNFANAVKERDEAIAARGAALPAAPAADGGAAADGRLAADLDAARARVLDLEREVATLTDRIVRADRAVAELDAARARAAGLEAEALAARGRADAAESAVARAEAAQRELQRAHAAEIANVRAETSRLGAAAAVDLNAAPGADVESLRARAAEAEEAVRTALREFGVDAERWPATPAGVVRAAGPLTLLALGEDVPGFAADPAEDTLAAAVLHLRKQAEERRRQLELAVARSADRR
jgi:hypothetical protein